MENEGHVLSLVKVHHTCRNIIDVSSLIKGSFELFLKCNRVIITHTSVFFGEGYLLDGLFLINVKPISGDLIIE